MTSNGFVTSGLLALAALAVTACGQAPLAERDPEGYRACSQFASYDASTDFVQRFGGSLVVARQARKASTKSIREAASESLLDEEMVKKIRKSDDGDAVDEIPLLDVEEFKKACSDAGFEF